MYWNENPYNKPGNVITKWTPQPGDEFLTQKPFFLKYFQFLCVAYKDLHTEQKVQEMTPA